MEGYLTINYIGLAAYITHLHIIAPIMAPLGHISTKMENTAAECCYWRGSVSSVTAVALPHSK